MTGEDVDNKKRPPSSWISESTSEDSVKPVEHRHQGEVYLILTQYLRYTVAISIYAIYVFKKQIINT